MPNMPRGSPDPRHQGAEVLRKEVGLMTKPRLGVLAFPWHLPCAPLRQIHICCRAYLDLNTSSRTKKTVSQTLAVRQYYYSDANSKPDPSTYYRHPFNLRPPQ